MIWANNNSYTNNSSYKSFKSKSEQNDVIYLNEDELTSLYNLTKEDLVRYDIEYEKEKPEKTKGDNSKKIKKLNPEVLLRIRDLFCFQCFTGVRYSDIQNISREDIKGSNWNFRAQKTHQSLGIPLNSYALSILARYNDYLQPLPIISNQKMNEYLKILCKKAKIDEPVK